MNHLVWHNGKTSWKGNSATHCDMMYGFAEVPWIHKYCILLHFNVCFIRVWTCMHIEPMITMHTNLQSQYINMLLAMYTYTHTLTLARNCVLHDMASVSMLDVRIMSVNSAAWWHFTLESLPNGFNPFGKTTWELAKHLKWPLRNWYELIGWWRDFIEALF